MPPPPDHEMPFIDHLRELRKRVIRSVWGLAIGGVIAFIFYQPIMESIRRPFEGLELQFIEITEPFLLKIRVSLYAGAVLSFPLHLYNIIAFIVPALSSKERRVLWALLAGSGALIVFGGYMGYFQVLPLAVRFLSGSEFMLEGVDTDLNMFTAVNFVVRLMLAFLILFQWPLVMVVLMATGVVSRQTFLRFGRYFIVIIFVVSAILTPPDIISQIMLGVPLAIFYYLAILLAVILRFGDENA